MSSGLGVEIVAATLIAAVFGVWLYVLIFSTMKSVRRAARVSVKTTTPHPDVPTLAPFVPAQAGAHHRRG